MYEVRAIAILKPNVTMALEGDTQNTAIRRFTMANIRNSSVFDWAVKYAGRLKASHVIVLTPPGTHKFLSPAVTIRLY